MTERILVTGGTGLLGSYILRWFKHHGYQNLTSTFQNPNAVIPNDLKVGIEWKRLRLPDIQDAFEVVSEKDWVIHSAALISYLKEDKYKLLEINQQGTEHIVNACLANNVNHLVYVGSIGALGKESDRVTLTEESPWLKNRFTTSYGLSKYLGELEAWRGAAEGMNVSVVLPSVILGTGDWQRSSLQIIHRVAKYAPLYPGGMTGYVDVRDVATFIGLLFQKSTSGERWILSGANLTYEELYKTIAKELAITRQYRQSPQWLAKMVLLLSNLKAGRMSFPEIADQIYARFTYDASKSRSMDGFEYRPITETIADVTGAYKLGTDAKPLPF